MARVTMLIALGFALTGCSVHDARTVADAPSALVGVSAEDLSLCAGLASKSEQVDAHTELRSYEYKSDGSDGVNINLPVIGGGFTLGRGGDCRATFKMVYGRVAQLRFSGDTNSGPGGKDSVCAPIVAHCLADLPPRATPFP